MCALFALFGSGCTFGYQTSSMGINPTTGRLSQAVAVTHATGVVTPATPLELATAGAIAEQTAESRQMSDACLAYAAKWNQPPGWCSGPGAAYFGNGGFVGGSAGGPMTQSGYVLGYRDMAGQQAADQIGGKLNPPPDYNLDVIQGTVIGGGNDTVPTPPPVRGGSTGGGSSRRTQSVIDEKKGKGPHICLEDATADEIQQWGERYSKLANELKWDHDHLVIARKLATDGSQLMLRAGTECANDVKTLKELEPLKETVTTLRQRLRTFPNDSGDVPNVEKPPVVDPPKPDPPSPSVTLPFDPKDFSFSDNEKTIGKCLKAGTRWRLTNTGPELIELLGKAFKNPPEIDKESFEKFLNRIDKIVPRMETDCKEDVDATKKIEELKTHIKEAIEKISEDDAETTPEKQTQLTKTQNQLAQAS